MSQVSIRYKNSIYNSTESLANLAPIIWNPTPTDMKETRSFQSIKTKSENKAQMEEILVPF